jgi:hypothetical protein
LTPEITVNYFSSSNYKEIWWELNTQEDRRERVIEWLDAMITTQISGEIEEMNKRVQTLKIQEVSRILKGTTMRRFIDK